MHRARFWQERAFKEVTTKQFLSHQWQVRQSVTNVRKLEQFLRQNVQAHESFTEQALQGVKASRMAVRLTPYVLSRMDWQNPEQCAIRKQFIPLAHETSLDHPLLTIDSLHEQESSPVPGLVHRYHDKALFLALSLCPVYCRFCTRSYGVGTTTETQDKSRDLVASRKRWQAVFEYIQQTPHLKDIVVSGGDCYQLTPGQLLVIKDALLAIPHIKRIRIATKGLAVSPSRIVEPEEQQDGWTEAVIQFAQEGRALGKHVALHTHFNHPQEISWISEDASQKFFQAGVTVRDRKSVV